MNATLEAVLTLNGASKRVNCFLAPGTKYTAGRESAWMRLPHGSVSRSHFHIWLENSRLMIEDAGSKNGVKINGKVEKLGVLNIGDVVMAGDFRIEIKGLHGGTVSEHSMRMEKGDDPADPKDWTRVEAAPVAPAVPSARTVPPGLEAITVEGLRFEKDIWIHFYRLAFTRPREFFNRLSTEGRPEPAWRLMVVLSAVMVAETLLSGLMTSKGQVVALLMMAAIMSGVMVFAILGFIGPGLSYVFRGFLKTREAAFSDFVRFGAFAATALPVVGLAQILFPAPLALLVQLAHSGWSLYGYFVVFRPDRRRYVFFLVASFGLALIVMGLAGAGLFLASRRY